MDLIVLSRNVETAIPSTGSIEMGIKKFRKLHGSNKIDNVFIFNAEEDPAAKNKVPVENWEQYDIN